MKPANTRFEARIDSEQKAYFERAALLAGYATLTQFILDAVRSKADSVFERQQRLITSTRDAERLQDILVNPPKPNEKMKLAFKRLKELQQHTNG